MKILVILRGQPRCNSNLYLANLEALDQWDAEVDVILDGVTDMYTITGKIPGGWAVDHCPPELKNTYGFHKDTSTIIENVAIANAWPTTTKIKIERLRSLETALKRLPDTVLFRFLRTVMTDGLPDPYGLQGPIDELSNRFENTYGQYLWFFDPPVDYSKYDLLLTLRQDQMFRAKYNIRQIDTSKFTFITDGLIYKEDKQPYYLDSLMGFTQPGNIHKILEYVNGEELWTDDIYSNFDNGTEEPYTVMGIAWTLLMFNKQKVNHKVMFGINELMSRMHRKISIPQEEHRALAFEHMPVTDMTHGRKNNYDEDFDFYYDERYNQKYKLLSKQNEN